MSGGYRKDKDVYLEVEDNGLGMPEEEAAELLNGKERPHKHGSGVGLVNVHSRLKLASERLMVWLFTVARMRE